MDAYTKRRLIQIENQVGIDNAELGKLISDRSTPKAARVYELLVMALHTADVATLAMLECAVVDLKAEACGGR